MTLRPRANEIPELIGRLGHGDPIRVDAAKARLSVIGARAVEALIETLEHDDDDVRMHTMQLLALIQDPRAREPLKAMLFERDPTIRAQAARAVARFPTRDSAAALERALRKAMETEVRVAAVEALIEIYVAGQECAVAPVLAVLLDPDEPVELRSAATALLPRLPGNERRTLRRRLEREDAPGLADAAAEATSPNPGDAEPDPETLLDALGSDDYGTWDDAVQRLTSLGAAVVEDLVKAMRRHAQDPEYCARAGMVLKAMGPRRGRKIADLVERVSEPLPLSILVEVVGAYGVNAMIYRLADVIEAIAARVDPTASPGEIASLERVRAKAHLELARIGSRVAIQDLRDALDAPHRRLELEMLRAVELVGKRDEIVHLLRAWRAEDEFMQDRIARVIRSVMRRERIRRNSVALRSLGERDHATLMTLLDRADPRRGRARRPRD